MRGVSQQLKEIEEVGSCLHCDWMCYYCAPACFLSFQVHKDSTTWMWYTYTTHCRVRSRHLAGPSPWRLQAHKQHWRPYREPRDPRALGTSYSPETLGTLHDPSRWCPGTRWRHSESTCPSRTPPWHGPVTVAVGLLPLPTPVVEVLHPGKAVHASKKTKTANSLILIDKMGQGPGFLNPSWSSSSPGWQGDPTATLLEIIDPELVFVLFLKINLPFLQNNSLLDHYLAGLT
jgi:hypothetical protein